MNLLIKYPTRGRPVWFIKTLDLFMKMLSNRNPVEIMVAMDTDDPTMYNDMMLDYLLQIEPEASSQVTLSWYYKDHIGKVDAVNSCINMKEFDVVLVISDDIEPRVAGFDEVIRLRFEEYFPDYDGILYFRDGRARPNRITIPIIGKKMYDYLGWVVHPDFVGWGDNYTSKVYIKTGKLVTFKEVLLEHCWCKYVRMDETYRRAAKYRRTDARTFNNLKDTIEQDFGK